LSWRDLGDGTYEVGVHIADVTYFMKPGTLLDDIAARRATTTYLIQRCYPMLPRMLCENLCSLAENEDRLAFSVIWRLDKDNNVLEEWFGRTVIRSCCKMAYGNAQSIINDPELDWVSSEMPAVHGGHSTADVKKTVLGLQGIAARLRKARFSAGALRLDKVKVGFKLDRGTGMPDGVFDYHMQDSNRLVEEFMLMANMAVAKKIHTMYPHHAMLRNHPTPKEVPLEKLCQELAFAGIKIETSSAGSLQKSLEHVGATTNKKTLLALQLMVTMPMQNANYICADDCESEDAYRHYALNVPFYTHFTSPIRRMADVVVHRLLASGLEGKKEPPCDSREVSMQAAICNERKKAAKDAQEASDMLFKCVYILEKGPFDEDGIVYKVQDRSFEVMVLRLGVEVRVLLDKLQDIDSYDFDKSNQSLKLRWRPSALKQAHSDTFKAMAAGGGGGGDEPAAAPAGAAGGAAPPPYSVVDASGLQPVKLFDTVRVRLSAKKDGPKLVLEGVLIPTVA